MEKKEFQGILYWVEMDDKHDWWIAKASRGTRRPYSAFCFTHWGAWRKALKMAQRMHAAQEFNGE